MLDLAFGQPSPMLNDIVSRCNAFFSATHHSRKAETWTVQELKQVHQLLNVNKNLKSILRTKPLHIKQRATGQKVSSVIPPSKMRAELPGLLAELNDQNTGPVAKACVCMGKLLLLHPFSDGNGRLSRALGTSYLMSHGLSYMASAAAIGFWQRYIEDWVVKRIFSEWTEGGSDRVAPTMDHLMKHAGQFEEEVLQIISGYQEALQKPPQQVIFDRDLGSSKRSGQLKIAKDLQLIADKHREIGLQLAQEYAQSD